MRSLFIKNIRYLVTCDEKDRILEHVNLYIEDGEIKYIGSNDFPADRFIDGTKMIAYPGLINTHHHLYQIFSRNLPQVQKMELFPWLKTLYEIWKNIDYNVVYYSSLTGLGELLKTGCTTCFDHHYVFPHGHENLMEAQFQAAKELGIRMHMSRGSMSLSRKNGGLPPESVTQTTEEILKDSRQVIEKFHDNKRFSMHQVALAPCSPFSVTEDLMKETAKLARDMGVRLHTHLAETKDEEAFVLEKKGMRPLEYMESMGWLGEDVWFAHGIYFNDRELKLLADTKTGVAHCPISNMKLCSGVARIPDMINMGIPVGLAVDGSASNDGSNLLEELRVAYLLQRLHVGYSAPSAYDFLKLATRGSAGVLGRRDIGYLSAGMAADLFMIRTDRLELTGALNAPASLLSTVGLKASVDYTIVDGAIVVEDGRLTNINEEYIVSNASNHIKQYLNK